MALITQDYCKIDDIAELRLMLKQAWKQKARSRLRARNWPGWSYLFWQRNSNCSRKELLHRQIGNFTILSPVCALGSSFNRDARRATVASEIFLSPSVRAIAVYMSFSNQLLYCYRRSSCSCADERSLSASMMIAINKIAWVLSRSLSIWSCDSHC